MRPRTLLVLAAIVALLGGFIFFYERKQPSPEERARGTKRVFSFESAEVRALRLERGGTVVRFERVPAASPAGEGKQSEDGEWWLREPVDDLADRFAVRGLVESLTGLESQRDLPEVDPATLGLDRPRAVVTLRTAKGETTLEIGAELPAGGVMAVALRGSRGGKIVPTGLFTDLTKEVSSWRSMQWSAAQVGDVESVEVSGVGETLSLRKIDGEWRRGEEKAGATEVSDLLYAVTSARAEEVLTRPAVEARGASLAQPKITLVLKLTQGREETLRSFAALAGGQLPAMVSGREAVLLLPASALQSIEAKLEAVRQWKPAAEPTPESPATSKGPSPGGPGT